MRETAARFDIWGHTLEDDEIILGLDYVEMVNLCFKLQIQRSYSSLGAYVRNNQFLLNLEVENKSWKYDDEQVFLVGGIKEVKKSCLFHKNNIWNQIVFEKRCWKRGKRR